MSQVPGSLERLPGAQSRQSLSNEEHVEQFDAQGPRNDQQTEGTQSRQRGQRARSKRNNRKRHLCVRCEKGDHKWLSCRDRCIVS